MFKPCKYAKLNQLIYGRGYTQQQFAGRMGIVHSTLTRKLNGTIPWSLNDVYRAGEILGIPDEQLFTYFPR